MRYALYFAPTPDTALARLGARWLGRDARTGETLEQPAIAGIDARAFAAMTAEPARYGFHATLKPPFRLADGFSARICCAPWRRSPRRPCRCSSTGSSSAASDVSSR